MNELAIGSVEKLQHVLENLAHLGLYTCPGLCMLWKDLKRLKSFHLWLTLGAAQEDNVGYGRVVNCLTEYRRHALTSAQSPFVMTERLTGSRHLRTSLSNY